MIKIDGLFFVIVSRGKANAVLRKAQECGATGGTIFLGEGTIQSKLLEKMGLAKTHKEILMIPASGELGERLHDVISEAFSFSKKNHGIAFTIPFKRRQRGKTQASTREEPSHSCIVTIVDKGRSKECIRAASEAGAVGGTVIHGRGAGVPTDFFFPLVIEPQKDIVMIIAPEGKAIQIKGKIFRDLELEKPGSGILFVLPVTETSGIAKTEPGGKEE